jgi:hypothetical protein
MDAVEIAAMLDQDRAEWDALVAVLEAHPVGPVHRGDVVAWTSRDMYAHLARWMERSTADIEARLAGRVLAELVGTDDEINANWQREDAAMSLTEARERAHAVFDRRVAVIESVPEERWSDAVLAAMARADGGGHFRDHRGYIATKS